MHSREQQHLPGHPSSWRCITVPPAHRVPYLVPTLPTVPRHTLWGTREGCSGRDHPDQGAAEEGGYLLLAHDPPLALGVHPHPARRKRHEKDVGSTPGQGQLQLWLRDLSGTMSLPVPGCGDMVGLWQCLPVVLGHRVHLWLLAARPPELPARGRQELIPILTAHSSSQPCQAPPMPGTPHSPHQLSGCHVPPSRAGSAPSGVSWLQGHSTREAASHLSCCRAGPGPTLSPFRPGTPCMP